MQVLSLILIGAVLLLLGYFIYGSFLSRLLRLNDKNKVPAVELRDDRDFIPTNKFYLLGQHLSAIAAAGPIVGPILAGLWFGWLPTALWIIIGGILIGGVHDMVSLVASVRHKGRSVAEVIKENMNHKAYIIFLLFLWISIIYIITAFTDITAGTFVDARVGPEVASSSIMYLGLALIMGIVLRYKSLPLSVYTIIFLPLVLLCIYLGPMFPVKPILLFGLGARTSWDIILLVYCFIASIIPLWLLLQPRGYLGGFFLVFTAGLSLVGIVVSSFTGGLSIHYPAFTQWVSPQGFPLIPMLFVTVACGACSGFHSIVCSGTTPKQIAKETDTKIVGFGGMLMESFVALIALATLLILTRAEAGGMKEPNQIYANGIAVFLNSLGINKAFALNFALLAFATFVYDTLDVATRLGRYIFQELTGWQGRTGACVATLATLVLPAFLVTREVTDASGNIIPAWKMFWTVFGSSNQLLAAMVLLGLSVWLFKKKINFAVAFLPALFMIVVAIWSICVLVQPYASKLFFKGELSFDPVATIGLVLILLAFLLIMEVAKVFRKTAR
ncbi:MAG: carbon starvation CstA family protein [Candidatus Omnitrophica bacterium]|nr:carbon starvation CstA family protein [Candidatus Omnitrophota bacterium]